MSRRRRSRALLRRAPTVAYSTASPGARASTFACPTASRACCCVFYRLARRAGLASPVTTSRTHALARAEPPPQTADADKKVPGDSPPRRSLKEDERLQVCQKNRFGRTWIFFPPTTSAGQAPTGGSSWRGCLQGLTGQHGLRTKEGFLTFGIGCPRQALSLDRVVPFPHTWFLFPPRRALAVAYSTASPGARASTFACPTASCALTVARSTASPGARASTFACSTASRACCCVFYRLARSRACCRVFYRLARRAGVDVRASDRAAAYCRVYPTASPGARASTFARPIASRAYCHVLCQGLTGKQALRQRECLSRKVFRALSLDVWASHLVFCCSWVLDRPGSDQGASPRGRATPDARRSRVLPPRQGRARARVARVFYRLAGARALTLACPAASRACCCVFYRLARRAGVDVNACPTASRACCCVFYRLARRAGVDVRAHYRAARLLSRNLPPRQARGRRRSRALPRRALAVAYSTASPGARGSPPLSRRQEHTRSRARTDETTREPGSHRESSRTHYCGSLANGAQNRGRPARGP